MTNCSKCGSQIDAKEGICPICGNETEKKTKEISTLKTVAKIFMIIGCVVSGFYFLIPLIWTIPMTMKYCNSIKNNQPISTGFKICTLLFVNLVAGILMLCDKDEE